jgi:hypothetical protein
VQLKDKQIELPLSHQKLLKKSNGIEAYGGYFRLFGFGFDKYQDLVTWNSDEVWKFAWRNLVKDFCCFVETAWGDQYAYNIEESKKSPNVYFLYADSMFADLIADSFETFIDKEFLRCAINPYDFMITLVRKKIGDLDSRTHITYSPSLMLGGEESLNNVIEINAINSMILNGDIATQISNQNEDYEIKKVEIYQDSKGRNRLRIIWVNNYFFQLSIHRITTVHPLTSIKQTRINTGFLASYVFSS